MEEYIVTLKSYDSLDEFYNDMETPGGSLTIPDRSCECCLRRSISRNTHYNLTEDEANTLKEDPRVLDVEKKSLVDSIQVRPWYSETSSDWDKSSSPANTNRNWGLLRVVNGDTLYPAESTYNINVTNSGASAYTLSGSDRNGSVSGNNVTVTLTVGDTLNFVVSASGHPFYIRVSNGGANVSTPEATNQGTQSGTVSWTPNTAGTYYYQCGIHAGMIGTITVNAKTSNWGSNGTVDASGTVTINASGKNVDVVIVDGHLNPDHPEFAVNSDGTGGTRVTEYNWYQHTSELAYGANGTYTYPTGTDLENPEDNHGMHVAGTVCGNTQGWARDANIYNISPYANAENPNTLGYTYTFDYVRAFHRNKAVNPLTGIKNPTICNNSWGSYYQITKSTINAVNWRGTQYTSNLTNNATLDSYGLVDTTSTLLYIDAWTTSLVADIEDAINEGIIMVGAAGNADMKLDVLGGTDYNNFIVWNGSNAAYYHRGSWNVVADNAVCVGAASALVTETKATFSQCGPRVDVYSPGDNIISCLHDGTVSGGTISTVNDSRNASYVLGKYDGTSMASPQVCGVLACALEQYPRMTPAEAVSYVQTYATTSQLSDSGGGYTDTTSLQGSENRYLFFYKERKESGILQPRSTFKSRPSSGQIWPRRSTFAYKK